MFLTKDQRSLIERVINVAETGTPQGNYGAISIYNDGPHEIKQVTYGRSQTTEYGNLRKLVRMYVNAGGQFGKQLKPYVDKIGAEPLHEDKTFLSLLREAGKTDPVMRSIQDQFFSETYFDPAMKWADANGFIAPLSALIIYDSFIHSGGILWIIRSKFPESPPSVGGDEKKWITAYTNARHNWLTNHSRPAVRPSKYRTQCYLAQIVAKNWDLKSLPVAMNGTNVNPA